MVTYELRNQPAASPAARESFFGGPSGEDTYRHWTWGPFRSSDHRRTANRRYAAVDG